MAVTPADVVGNFQRGYGFGTQIKEARRIEDERNQIRNLAPKVLQGDQAAYQQVATINPEAANTLQDSSDRQFRRLSNVVGIMEQALKTGNPQAIQQAHATVSPWLSEMTGKPVPPQWDESMRPNFERIAQQVKMAQMGNMAGAPAGFQQFQMTANAAGLIPGSPEYQQAAKIALGQEGRAASGGYGFFEFEGADGRKRLGRNNPRTGMREIYDEGTGQFIPLGGGQSSPSIASPMPAMGANPQQDYSAIAQEFPGVVISSTNRTPERNAQVGGVPNSQHIRGTAADFVVPQEHRPAFLQRLRSAGYEAIDEGDHIHAELPPQQRMAQAAGLATGRSPEEQAGLTTAAQEAAKFSYLGPSEQIKTDAAVEQATREAQARAEIENRQKLDATAQARTVNADRTLGLLDEAERIIGGSTGSRAGAIADEIAAAGGISTAGGQAIAQLRTIAGQLTASMPRMEGPQSDKDVQMYRDMAGDLANPNIPRETRLAALRTIRALQQKYASKPQGKTVTRTGTSNGRKVVQYSDGSIEYAD